MYLFVLFVPFPGISASPGKFLGELILFNRTMFVLAGGWKAAILGWINMWCLITMNPGIMKDHEETFRCFSIYTRYTCKIWWENTHLKYGNKLKKDCRTKVNFQHFLIGLPMIEFLWSSIFSHAKVLSEDSVGRAVYSNSPAKLETVFFLSESPSPSVP